MSEFVDIDTIAQAAPYRRLPHHQVADWQAACDRAVRRRLSNGVLRFGARGAPLAATSALLGLPRRRPVLPFVHGAATRGATPYRAPDDPAA
jgi:hypothetical protein